MKIQGEQKFSVPENSFSVSPSAEGYTLEYSADGVDFTEYTEATPADEVLIVYGVSKHMTFKLKGNESEVFIQY